MAATLKAPQDIDITFTAAVYRDDSIGGWTVVTMEGSGEFFGTRKPVKVAGTMDGHPFEATLLPKGDGTHLVPIKAALRKTIGKAGGDSVTIHLTHRFT
ncbi:MAG: DUF1905 domain-containing protein [Thermomicrobiales bacterium]